MTEPVERDTYGLAHAIKTTIKLATFVAPTRFERNTERRANLYSDTEDAIAERVMAQLRRKFRVTWRGSDDESDNAWEPER
jgi:hypothetical protein